MKATNLLRSLVVVGSVVASMSMIRDASAAIAHSVVPDCWSDARNRSIEYGGYTAIIHTDALSMPQAMRILSELGRIPGETAMYPEFPITCGSGTNNCIVVWLGLSQGTRDNLNNGFENEADVMSRVEQALSPLLEVPGAVHLECTIEPRR